MAAPINNTLMSLITQSTLTGLNYEDWHRNIMLLLKAEGLDSVLTEESPTIPSADMDGTEDIVEFTAEQLKEKVDIFKSYHQRDSKTQLYILNSIDKSIVESVNGISSAGDMMAKIKELYSQQDTHIEYELVDKILSLKMEPGTPVLDHVMKVQNLFEQLEGLGSEKFSLKYKRNVIFKSLPGSFSSFIFNFNMNKLDVQLTELGNMYKKPREQLKRKKQKCTSPR
ncbi:uncharacterized protein LOC122668660 [Telopea speciosissima]|uniref:uncharacterized protein LOC122668660 n=1 Tax=Telopea speciosissima TaxID=54955 RepID=UPI001CC37899|nr:uncharacterized protein LOC122668660 [Telopea speciosissima]